MSVDGAWRPSRCPPSPQPGAESIAVLARDRLVQVFRQSAVGLRGAGVKLN